MFTSSHPFLLFDYLRVPYDVRAAPSADGWATGPLSHCGRLLCPSGPGSPSLFWPLFEGSPAPPRAAPVERRFHLGDLVLHGRLLADEVVAEVLRDRAGGGGRAEEWVRAEPLCGDDGARVGSVWRAGSGSTVLPFDPSEVITGFWSERYARVAAARPAGRARSAAMRVYYTTRPLLPRRLQIAARRAYSRVQVRSPFPRWPVEDSLHGFLDLLLSWSSSLAGRPVPWIAPWPAGRSWALVLTHDVETARGVSRIAALRDVEQRSGHRSSWNFVPGRYRVDDALVAQLQETGSEVGVHGFLHDGRDLDPVELPERLPQMRRYAERWGAVGFRSPATHRDWETMSTLPFDYDSSYPDSDPFEPQPGGCCSWLPFCNRGLVELPITLPQDHTLFVVLRARDGRLWVDKAERIRASGGLALLITHPDYVDEAPVAQAYAELLAHFADDPGVWRALPAEVAGWWRRRAASRVESDGGGWRVSGPAAGEASIRLTGPPPGRAGLPGVGAGATRSGVSSDGGGRQ